MARNNLGPMRHKRAAKKLIAMRERGPDETLAAALVKDATPTAPWTFGDQPISAPQVYDTSLPGYRPAREKD